MQALTGGPIAHYKVQIDKTAPEIISVKLSSEKIKKDDVVRMLIDTNDLGSGIQQNYYIDLGNHLFLPTKSQLFIPFMERGLHKLKIRVYDNAGNYSEQNKTIKVE